MLVPSTAGEKQAGNFGSTCKFRDRSRSSAVVLGNDTTQSEIAVNSHASELRRLVGIATPGICMT
jgi:hypothetical protein